MGAPHRDNVQTYLERTGEIMGTDTQEFLRYEEVLASARWRGTSSPLRDRLHVESFFDLHPAPGATGVTNTALPSPVHKRAWD